MPEKILAEIIKLCVMIDTIASQVYMTLSDTTEDVALRIFWREMSNEEKQHVIYWETLLEITNEGRIDNIFDEPQKIKQELEILKTKAILASDGAKNNIRVSTAFLLAFRLEFYLIHPAFEALFRLMKELTGDATPADEYEAHINKLIEGRSRFADPSPELEVIAESINQMWQSNRQLATQLANIRTLRGLIPMCLSCKRIRNDEGSWQEVGIYVSEYSGVDFTHGICDDCFKRLYPHHYERLSLAGKAIP